MGTRADFYVGRGENAEWIGSVAYDGHPDNFNDETEKNAPSLMTTEDGFRKAVAKLASRDDFTKVEDGWPWPWADSNTSDYAYAFDCGKVWCSRFGSPWFDASGKEPDKPRGKKPVFPDMTKVQNVTLGKRSGAMFLSIK